MPRVPSRPPLPDSPGAWLACFRHRLLSEDGRRLSPEQFGRLIGRSGATVRRWESNRAMPDEGDIARIARVCRLTSMQAAFLSYAFSRHIAIPGPPEHDFKPYMRRILSDCKGPAIIFDSMLYQRAWNSYIDALSTGTADALAEDRHPLEILLRSRLREGVGGDLFEETVRNAVSRFWMTTSSLCSRPEYAALVSELDRIPGFRDHWLELAREDVSLVLEPISHAEAIAPGVGKFRVYQTMIIFPPYYYLYEYVPQDERAHSRLAPLVSRGEPEVHFHQRLHWTSSLGRRD